MTYETVLTALSDPTRRHIFECLRTTPRTVSELAATQTVSRPAVSQHLRVLEDAGLVKAQPQGTKRIYHMRREGLADLRGYIDGFWDDVLTSFANSINNPSGGSHDGPSDKDD